MHLLAVTKGFKAHSSHIRSKTSAYFHFTAAETEAPISYFSCCSSWSWCGWQHQECGADLITYSFTHQTIFLFRGGERAQKEGDDLSKAVKYKTFCKSNIRAKNLNTPYTEIQSKGFHSSIAWPYCVYTILHCSHDVKGIF